MATRSSHQSNFTIFISKVKKLIASIDAEQNTVNRLESIGFDHLPKSVLRSYKDYLDSQALSLVGNNDAYYRNRLQSWILTDKIKQGGI